MNFKTATLIPVLALLAACTHDIPAHQAAVSPDRVPVTVQTVQPIPGEQVIVTIPSHRASPPVATIVTTPRPNPPVSMLPLTLTGDLTPIENMARAAMPDSFNEIGHPLSSDFRWNFVRSGEPQVSIHDGRMTVRADYVGSIETKGVTARACRLNPVYPVIEETAQLDIKQLGDRSVITLVNPRMNVWLKPESDARCNMFNVPLQEQVRELLNADVIHARLARSIEHAGMRIQTDGLNGPLAYSMQPGQGTLCVYPGPQNVTVGELEGNQRQAVLKTMAVVSPTALVGSPCPATAMTPVPVRVGPVPDAQPLTIASGVMLPYDSMTQIVDSRLRSTEISLGDGHNIQIERVGASDASGRVLFALDTTGYLRGTLYFWGTPELQLQPQTGRTYLAISDLRLDPESTRVLDDIEPGLGAAVDQKMSGKLRQASNIDLSDQIAGVQNAMTTPYRTGDVVVTFTPVRLYHGQAYSTPQGVVTDVTMEATGSGVGKFYIVQG